MAMNREHYQRVRSVFHAAGELNAADRAAYLDETCADAPEIRGEVEELLAMEDTTGAQALEQPVLDGGLLVEQAAAVVSGCILYGNHRQEERDESAQIHIHNGLLSINYSCVQGWTGDLGGTGNIGDDPRFVDPEGGDHRLLSGSPVIDAADNTPIPRQVLVDLDRNPRFVDDPETENTGRGVCPIVDMGAYEFQAEGGCCLRDPRWICDADVDADGQVNPVDSGLVQTAFGSGDESHLCQYDLNCDGQINLVDAGIVRSLFGTCNEPRDACP